MVDNLDTRLNTQMLRWEIKFYFIARESSKIMFVNTTQSTFKGFIIESQEISRSYIRLLNSSL